MGAGEHEGQAELRKPRFGKRLVLEYGVVKRRKALTESL